MLGYAGNLPLCNRGFLLMLLGVCAWGMYPAAVGAEDWLDFRYSLLMFTIISGVQLGWSSRFSVSLQRSVVLLLCCAMQVTWSHLLS